MTRFGLAWVGGWVDRWFTEVCAVSSFNELSEFKQRFTMTLISGCKVYVVNLTHYNILTFNTITHLKHFLAYSIATHYIGSCVCLHLARISQLETGFTWFPNLLHALGFCVSFYFSFSFKPTPADFLNKMMC